MLSPPEYMQRYREITVSSASDAWNQATVSVDRYLLNTPSRQQGIMNERAKLARKVSKDLAILRAADPEAGLSVLIDSGSGPERRTFATFTTNATDQLWALLRYPFVGKGSPEAVSIVLQLAAVDLPGSPAIVSPENFQSYCDTWLGLDCNGLVGNYLRHVLYGIPWDDVSSTQEIGPDSDISIIWNRFSGTEYSHAGDVDPSQLILAVLVDEHGKVKPGGSSGYGHILLSGPGESTSIDGLKAKLGIDQAPAICTVESTHAVHQPEGKDGLFRGWSAYAESKAQAGVFRLLRGVVGPAIPVRMKGMNWSG